MFNRVQSTNYVSKQQSSAGLTPVGYEKARCNNHETILRQIHTMFRLLKKQDSCYLRKCQHKKHILNIKCSSINCSRHKSFYQVLGLNSTASSKDIKSAYYKLCLQFHPDKNNDPDSIIKFREITQAYEVLINPEKKKIYDQNSNFTPHYSYNYKEKTDYYGSFKTKRYEAPFTGRTKDFNYDEHYRQHYEKQRQQEYEYFKRRWEAEYYRREGNYPGREEYFRNQYKETDHQNLKETYNKYFFTRLRIFYFFLPTWAFFLMVPFLNDILNPESDKYFQKIYYKVRDQNEGLESSNDGNK